MIGKPEMKGDGCFFNWKKHMKMEHGDTIKEWCLFFDTKDSKVSKLLFFYRILVTIFFKKKDKNFVQSFKFFTKYLP